MEEWLIYKEFRFEAAHRLPHHDGKCSRLHGHSWVGRVYVKGNQLIEEGSKQGMIMDYGDIKTYLKPLLDNFLDHYYLNETTGLENPTSEAIAKWVFERLEEAGLPGLYAVEIQETCTSGTRYSRSQKSEVRSQKSEVSYD
ncbi:MULTISPECIES: 6-carboxytetrahydropterin synthase QueD [Moorena]|nr:MULTISPECIES: 6-carboxytetrahydropterin synthase QueD [Moorena]NES86252.1 6-carboxytetrahydropterin synthase QueD [Moorena sp. SIO2B7]NEP33677.1 6-carboxytetrahydropterin synthase QueD [Moorena sp. SIO3B2]NEP69705.1 6-carboxytetrahydropterin synthase QueD [Moorena sp. SIO3A5]NER91580.1 6-carboxytetrahydropterin synthase QueD [Moorena sp. SIO3A2]NES42196.1 6-carboxytetrahydropterin synthase QueD [Moorena sp. SIO2C4]